MLPKVHYAVVEVQHSRKRCPNAMINLEIYCLDHGSEFNNTGISTQHVQTGWSLELCSITSPPTSTAGHCGACDNLLIQHCIISPQQNNPTQLRHAAKIEGRALASDLSSS
jgi:hypothetical protein